MQTDPEGQLDELAASHPCEQYPFGKSFECRQMPVPHETDVEQVPPVGASEVEDEHAMKALPANRAKRRKERIFQLWHERCASCWLVSTQQKGRQGCRYHHIFNGTTY